MLIKGPVNENFASKISKTHCKGINIRINIMLLEVVTPFYKPLFQHYFDSSDRLIPT